MTSEDQNSTGSEKRHLRRWVIAAAVGLFVLAWWNWPIYYRGEAIHGRVVDAETGAPLPGVVVVATWVMVGSTLGGSGTIGLLRVDEAVTGKEGNYTLPAWGMIWNPAGGLGKESPRLTFFKNEYEPISLVEEAYSNWLTVSSMWDDQTIELKRYRGHFSASARDYKKRHNYYKRRRLRLPFLSFEEEGYIAHVRKLRRWLDSIISAPRHPKCGWKRIPRMLLEITEVVDRGLSEGLELRFMDLTSVYYLTNDPKRCGNVLDYFQRNFGFQPSISMSRARSRTGAVAPSKED